MGRTEQAGLAAGVLSIPVLAFFLATGGGGSSHGSRVILEDIAFEVPEGWRYDVYDRGGQVVGAAGVVTLRRDVEQPPQFDPAVWERVVIDGETAYRAEQTLPSGYFRQIVFPDGVTFDFRARTQDIAQALPAFDVVADSIQVLD